MYTIVVERVSRDKSDLHYRCICRVQDGTEEWYKETLEEAISSMIDAAKLMNGSTITRKDISIARWQRMERVSNHMVEWDGEGDPYQDESDTFNPYYNERTGGRLPTTCYVVRGVAFEKRDSEEWDVACYFDKEQAELHARMANEELKKGNFHTEMEPEVPRLTIEKEEEYRRNFPFDTNTNLGRFGTCYKVVSTPIFLHVDQYQERR